MKNPERIAGLRGHRESHAPEGLKLHNLRTTAPEMPPASADVSGGLSQWGMLGNGFDPDNLPCYPNGAGDCGPAATEHLRMAKAAIDGKFPTDFRPPHTQYTQELYIAYQQAMGEPGQCPDNGVTNLSWLSWMYQQTKTHPGMDVLAFAEVDLTNLPAGWTAADVIHRAMIDFRGALVGAMLTDQADGQFVRAEPWSVSPTDPVDPTQAHDVLLAAYGAEPVGATNSGVTYRFLTNADDWFVTWGTWQPATVAWESAAITDVWVILTKEDADRAGYDFEAAVAQIETMLNADA